MHIWVDADACPAVIKDILFRVAERLQLNVTLVANQLLRVPGSRFIRALQVPAGADAADAEIVERVSPGDIVVTGDSTGFPGAGKGRTAAQSARRVVYQGHHSPAADDAGFHGRAARQRRRHRRPGSFQPGRPPELRQCARPRTRAEREPGRRPLSGRRGFALHCPGSRFGHGGPCRPPSATGNLVPLILFVHQVRTLSQTECHTHRSFYAFKSVINRPKS
jgi:hypothetical protein